MVRIHLPVQETQEVWVQSLVGEYPLEEEIATHSSILAWEIPWTEEPGGLQSTGLQRIRHNWAAKQQQPVCYLATLAGTASRRPSKARSRFSAWRCNLSQGFGDWILGGRPKAADSWELLWCKAGPQERKSEEAGICFAFCQLLGLDSAWIQEQLIDIS